MKKYAGTFSCGHKGDIYVAVPEIYEGRMIKRSFARECSECRKKRRAEQLEERDRENFHFSEELDLPQLQGTGKQVRWGMSLRIHFLGKVQEKIEQLEAMGFQKSLKLLRGINSREDMRKIREEALVKLTDFEQIKDLMLDQLQRTLFVQTEAAFWISSRSLDAAVILMDEYARTLLNQRTALGREWELQIIEEGGVAPEHPVHSDLVQIYTSLDTIRAVYPRSTVLKELMVQLFYSFQKGAWVREVDETCGSLEDRAVELGCRLLNAGFRICYMDRDLRQRALYAEYEPEHMRWVVPLEDGRLGLWWKKKDDRLYNAARRMRGARWISPYIAMCLEDHQELEEYAYLFGFRYTVRAGEMLERYKQEAAVMLTGEPAAPRNAADIDRLEEILKTSSDILEDLKDEDIETFNNVV